MYLVSMLERSYNLITSVSRAGSRRVLTGHPSPPQHWGIMEGLVNAG
jgi:hypothetical protein